MFSPVLNYFGSLLWCTCLVPLYLYGNNYPIFKFKNIAIAIVALGTFFIFFSFLLKKFFIRSLPDVIDFQYLCGGLFWFSKPAIIYLMDHNIFFFIKIGNIHYPIALIGISLILCLILYLAKFCNNAILKVNGFFTLFTLILISLLLLQTFKKILSQKITSNQTSKIVHTHTHKQYPNIYHILLDAYPNQKAMSVIGGNIKPFYKKLSSLGFITYPYSYSNYPATIYSVPSMLSMDYLEGDETKKDYYHYCSLNQNNKVFEELSKNYTIHITNSSDFMDKMYSKKYLSEKVANNDMLLHCFYTIFQYSLAESIFKKLFAQRFALDVRKNIHNLLKNLTKAKKNYGASGNFFYAHILCPHEPIIYGKYSKNQAFDGFINRKDWSYLLKPETRKSFCDNTYGINKEILPTLEKIIKQYENEPLKPIIILHSDHSILYCGIGLKSPYITKETIYGNLLALYLPPSWEEDAKSLTFINLYRFIFNNLFGDHYAYLPHKQICRGQEYGVRKQ